jgi:hypothetical protein
MRAPGEVLPTWVRTRTQRCGATRTWGATRGRPERQHLRHKLGTPHSAEVVEAVRCHRRVAGVATATPDTVLRLPTSSDTCTTHMHGHRCQYCGRFPIWKRKHAPAME